MKLLEQVKFLLHISHTDDIARRYFVVNGFDGALTMMGLIIGFLVSDTIDMSIIISVCLSASIALAMSGMSSAWLSESAERLYALKRIEEAMISDLHDSAHGKAARLAPLLIALVNGLAPLIISLLILLPMFVDRAGFPLTVDSRYVSLLVALLLIFLLGVFLGRISGRAWFRGGCQTLLVAVLTAVLIYMFAGR